MLACRQCCCFRCLLYFRWCCCFVLVVVLGCCCRGATSLPAPVPLLPELTSLPAPSSSRRHAPPARALCWQVLSLTWHVVGVVMFMTDMACSRCSSVHGAIACLLALPVPSHACDWCCHLATRSLPSSTRSHFYLKPFGRRRRGVGNQSGASGRSWRFCSQSLAFAAACTLQICRAREILRSGLCFDLL